jgi:uncharacterized SAM-binding protein YcdF (DUF218 family)
MNITTQLHSMAKAPSRFRAAKRGVVALLLLAIACVSIWHNRATLLEGAAKLWIVSDTVSQADAVAIFGGGLEVRPFAAAEYYKAGLVKKILVSNVQLNKAEILGAFPSHTALNRKVLLKLGIPESAIESFGTDLSNTFQEAIALREWAVRNDAHRVIVPTQAFSSRRVRWVLQRELSGAGIQIQVPALDDNGYNPSNWWKDDKVIIEFQNEVIKYVYYRLKY